MPSALPHDDDDPVIASYDVYITNPLPKTKDLSTHVDSGSRLLVLQYPSHRPSYRPYTASTSQKPTRLRLKPGTGMVEVEVPIRKFEYFNEDTGHKYAQSLTESRTLQFGASHGLAGGFVTGPGPNQNISLHDIPAHGERKEQILETQTLGGKVIAPNERDPIYMLGSFKDNELHLTHLDAVVQMRPQLHHIDAEEEANQKKHQAQTGASGKVKPGLEAAAKLESKAIELKMKDSKEDPKDRNINHNAALLRSIQADQWHSHVWVDEDDGESWHKGEAHTTLSAHSHSIEKSIQLQSTLTNDDWLEKMSIPREDGKKGLRAKLKGRDRERARRKKVEYQRRQTNPDNINNTSRAEISSDSEISSLAGQSDVEVVDTSTEPLQSAVKEETDISAGASASTLPDTTRGTAPRKRGRPKKT